MVSMSKNKKEQDIDECADPINCVNGFCVNTPGRYECNCPPDFQLNPTGVGCVDIDECQELPGLCQGGNCINTFGSFQCECPHGYYLSEETHMRKSFCYRSYNGTSCDNELPFNVTKRMCCCTYNVGKAWNKPCEPCPTPGTGILTRILEYCKIFDLTFSFLDVNECLESPGICSNGHCINTDGSFRCECPLGYNLDYTGVHCVDTDECSIGNPCGNGTCSNVIGSFECNCLDGFEPGPMMNCEGRL
uniref:Uncharacterized protein n=1 Tax=Varanus komodoensis TaxID=61221 RepID=A0A8D2J7Q9_VARKO